MASSPEQPAELDRDMERREKAHQRVYPHGAIRWFSAISQLDSWLVFGIEDLLGL